MLNVRKCFGTGFERFALIVIATTFGLYSITLLAKGDGSQSPREIIESHYSKLKKSYDRNGALDEEIETSLKELFHLEKLASQVLQNHWTDLNRYEQKKFVEAFTISLQKQILTEIGNHSSRGLPSVRFNSEETKEKSAKLNLTVSGDKGGSNLTLFFLKYAKEGWKVSNVKYEDESLLREYYSYCDEILDDFSIPYLIAEIKGADYVVLDDFEAGEVGKLPVGWSWRDRDDDKNKPYTIRKENGNKYLAARDEGESVILGKDVKWNLNKYPYISFRWRAIELPVGGDERYGKTVDSAAGIYLVYKKKLGLIPESVKFVWSTTLPVGAYMKRSGIGKPWMVVAASGDEHLGEWRTFTFNAREAYKKTFGGDPPDDPVGLGILSDANSTHSKAYTDYDDIRALKHADADSGVKQFMKAE
ncbi:DUF3047 domain-containing protein [candidate division KSB1 bacterium]|nr:DUF3047 domain-containing protein [candidate division KSB1 bacterium]NIR68655.1 DUF3047 domain-containing protein [candidate division KSB1 bacterium]NIS27144.1 DUF3047 domain-containing protein [candidate division KSB1 bacterium]NIT74030.1 DUF3047 domain-containing protein [candidate division KSB1 bacterium]NIU27896.1 DUF3047 domain-containing protein [candidate division KSB1 bacterium]